MKSSRAHPERIQKPQNGTRREDSAEFRQSATRRLSQISSLWLCQFRGSWLVTLGKFSISFPVRCQSSVEVLFSKVQLQGIHAHGCCNINPSPKVATSITSLTGPPVIFISTYRCKVLHQETSVDSYQNAGAEPAKQSEDLACAIRVLKGWLLG